MQITDLESLAVYHEEIARNHAEVAQRMLGDVAAGFRSSSTRHATWAQQLRELIASFHTFTAHT